MNSHHTSSLHGIRIAILVASDKGARGERADRSGAWLVEALGGLGAHIDAHLVVLDELEAIAEALKTFADELAVDLVFTCGGTGFTARDITPEATQSVIERAVPGIPEALRATSLQLTPMAMLSRGIAGIRGATLIINLPGSLKAVQETLPTVLPVLPHAVETLRSLTGVDCGKRR